MLDRPIQRIATPSPSRARSATKRRVVVGVLALLSLALLTGYFREAPGGPLHDLQGVGASLLRPFQVGAVRVARPFRDLHGYVAGLANAKEENERLRAQNEALRRRVILNEQAAQDALELREALSFHDAPSLRDFRRLNTRVLSYPPSRFDRTLVVAVGSDDGVHRHAPVLGNNGFLVGEVTSVTSGTAVVTLLTDATSAVAARVLETGANGLLEAGPDDTLYLNRVTKDRAVRREDIVVTAGSRIPRLPSIFPRGIPVGFVSSVGQTDTDPYKQIQVRPYLDYDALYAVSVYVRPR